MQQFNEYIEYNPSTKTERKYTFDFVSSQSDGASTDGRCVELTPPKKIDLPAGFKDLDNLPGANDQGLSSRNILGSKDRRYRIGNTLVYPHVAICKLFIEFPKENVVGTGAIYGRREILTAAHCVYSSSRGGYANAIWAYAGWDSYDGGTIAQDASLVSGYNMNAQWIAGNINYDYCVLKLDRPLGTTCGYFGYRWQAASYNGTNARLFGYPASPLGQYGHYGDIKESQSFFLRYDIDTTGGQSGSPVYLGDGSTIIATHRGDDGAYNRGRRIDESLYNYMASLRT